ncbi:hypothetical protein ES705_48719 [subsurface metagenome]
MLSLAGLVYSSDSFIKVTATDTYAIRTLAEVKADLDLEIGTDIQAFDNALNSISGLTYASPSFIKMTALDTYAVRTLAEVKTDLSLNNVTNVATDDTVYNATSWDDNTDAATKNAIRDKIETMGNGGYTNLTQFVNQTAWRLFYSDTDGDVVELALGADGTYLKSGGAAVEPTWETPAGAGTVITSGTPVANDYARFTASTVIEGRSYAEAKADLGFISDVVDDTTPELGGEMDAGAHSIGFTVQTITSSEGTATIDWGNSNKARITLSENTVLAFTDPANSGNYMLIIIQPAGDNAYTTTFPAGIYWAGSTKVSVPTTNLNRCIVSFAFDDEDASDVWYCQGTETFATDD